MTQTNERARERRLIGALLRVPLHAVMAEVYEGLRQAGFDDLRPAHLVVFQNIDLDGSRLTELAERAVMTKQSMGYLVDYLEERGYVERAADPQDGRARIVRPTARGWQVHRKAFEVVLGVEERWAGLIGRDKMAQLIDTLSELMAALGEEPATDYVPRMRAGLVLRQDGPTGVET